MWEKRERKGENSGSVWTPPALTALRILIGRPKQRVWWGEHSNDGTVISLLPLVRSEKQPDADPFFYFQRHQGHPSLPFRNHLSVISFTYIPGEWDRNEDPHGMENESIWSCFCYFSVSVWAKKYPAGSICCMQCKTFTHKVTASLPSAEPPWRRKMTQLTAENSLFQNTVEWHLHTLYQVLCQKATQRALEGFCLASSAHIDCLIILFFIPL